MKYELKNRHDLIDMPYEDFLGIYGKAEYKEIYEWDRNKYAYGGKEGLLSSWLPLEPVRITYQHFSFSVKMCPLESESES